MGIRAALGAGRWRLVRGLLVEGVVLSLAGAAVGVLLAYGGVGIIRAWMPANVPRVADIGIDLRVLAATIATAVLTGISFGIVPAFQSSRPDLTTTLKDSGRSSTAGRGTQWLRNSLVVCEVALAVVLLVGAGLFIGSFVRLMRVETGFDYRNVLVQNVGLRVLPGQFAEAAKRGNAYVDAGARGRAAVPGVETAAAVSGGLPLTGSWSRTGVELPGRPKLEGDDDSIDRRLVTANYLQLLRIPLIRGRYLSDDDRAGSEMVIVVNEAAARKYWPGQDPIGQRVTLNSKERMVVGVVGDIRHLGPETPPRQECYMPFSAGRQHRRDTRHANGRRSAGGAAGGEGRDLVGQQGAAAVERHGDARRLHGSPDRAAALQHGAAGALRRAGARDRRGRHLRRDGLRRGAAHERDRRADGARGDPAATSSRWCSCGRLC